MNPKLSLEAIEQHVAGREVILLMRLLHCKNVSAAGMSQNVDDTLFWGHPFPGSSRDYPGGGFGHVMEGKVSRQGNRFILFLCLITAYLLA